MTFLQTAALIGRLFFVCRDSLHFLYLHAFFLRIRLLCCSLAVGKSVLIAAWEAFSHL